MSLIVPAVPYFLAAGVCFLLIARLPAAGPLKAQMQAWKAVCVILAFLGVVRPYEVHAQLSSLLRTSAMTGGWYGERMHRQFDLVLVGSFLALVVGAFLLFETRRWHRSTRTVVLVALYLCGVFVLNVLSLHGLDALLNRRMIGIPLRWAVDLPALALTVALALSSRRYVRTGGMQAPSAPPHC